MKSFVKSQLKPVKNDVKALTTTLDTTNKLALENQGDVKTNAEQIEDLKNLASENPEVSKRKM